MSDSIKLSQLKAKIDKIRTEVIMEEGNLATFYRELQDDFGCSSVEEARKKSDNLYARSDTVRQKLEKGIQEVRDEYRI